METVIVDDPNNVWLIIQDTRDDSQAFIVHSTILQLASPVFETLITPHFSDDHETHRQSLGRDGTVQITLNKEHSSPSQLFFDIVRMRALRSCTTSR